MTDTFTIRLDGPLPPPLMGHLKMGGINPRGRAIAANSQYLSLDGHPWLPVMGEFHYSRYPAEKWLDELLKMKAGGLSIVSSYIFWIHHEEVESRVEWSGSLDLRRFVTLCGECGLFFFARIGPWVHGEARNGGLPDWLLEHCGGDLRRNDPTYLEYVHRWYGEISRQLTGLMWKDGGPVIGIQLENELLDQPAHLLTLKRMAIKAGLEAPLYTMTGWGPAQIPTGDEIVPLFGGYPDACWDRYTDDWARECRINYFFNLLRDDNAIGTDLLVARPGGRMVDLDRYPFGACELGGGMQTTYHRRAFITPSDVAALVLAKLGSGNNLHGYYVFHGGSHPRGQNNSLQETQASGYPNDYPLVSYDFQAPLGEFGQVRQSYHTLRPLHLFLQDFGSLLAPMPAALPDKCPHTLDDTSTLRWTARSDGRSGFIFVNNYQRIESLPAHASVQFVLHLAEEGLTLPAEPMDIPSGAFFIWPFNLSMNGVRLKYATAQLICRIAVDDAPAYVFSAVPGIPPEFAFEPEIRIDGQDSSRGIVRPLPSEEGPATFLVHGPNEQPVRLLLLSEKQASQSCKAFLWGGEHLFISPAMLLFEGDRLRLQAARPEAMKFTCFPPVTGLNFHTHSYALFTEVSCPVTEKEVRLEAWKLSDAAPARPVRFGSQGVATPPEESVYTGAETWQIRLPADAFEMVSEVFLVVEYQGDCARLCIDGQVVADDFYSGCIWEIGLRRFLPQMLESVITLQVLPLHPQAPVYIQPEFRPDGGPGCVRHIWLERMYERTLELKTE